MAQLPIPGWRLVHGGPSAAIYENSAAMPRAWLVPEVELVTEPDGALERMLDENWDPARTGFVSGSNDLAVGSGELVGEATIEARGDGSLTIRTTSDRPALLVMAENWYDGWVVTIDGEPAELRRVNHTFQGVVVGEGEHLVELSFEPESVKLGLLVYLACLALLAGYGGWYLWKGRPAGR